MTLANPSPLRQLTATPHRMMFFAGTLQGVAAVGWWLADLLGRYAGWYAPLPWTVTPMWAHAYLMIYGLFPFFMFGFMMTAMPSWLDGGKVPRRAYVAACLIMLGGMALFYIGLRAGRGVVIAGVALHLAGWAVGWTTLARLVAGSHHPKRHFPMVLLGVFALGWLGALCYLLWLATGASALLNISWHGIWYFLLPVFFAASTRLVPFFSSRVLADYVMYTPRWVLPLGIVGALAHAALSLGGAQRWLIVPDAAMAIGISCVVVRWGLLRSFRVRLLAVLHISLAALAIALWLFVIQDAALLWSGRMTLGAAPLHALTIGFFTAMVIAMVSRVSLGHSGRALVADALTWWCFLGVIAAAGVRVVAEVPFVPGTVGLRLSALAAALWLLCFGVWACRYLPMYWRPRVDGKPG
ncbi:MAG TPA: NnrS family protein [Burkholderiales bacterium]|nr:NnrS family protein [Burkholderiales bacterium]